MFLNDSSNRYHSIVDAYSRSADGKKSEGNASRQLLRLFLWDFPWVNLRFAIPTALADMSIDGVVDPEDWVSGNGVNEITLTDEVFSTLFLYYNLTGSECAFYSGTTAHHIYLRFGKPSSTQRTAAYLSANP
jgi:hypothetical protein